MGIATSRPPVEIETYRHRESGHEIEAIKHDGSDEIGLKIAMWIAENGQQSKFVSKGTLDYDLDNAFVVFGLGDKQVVVMPAHWLIRVEGARFYLVNERNFNQLYEAVSSGEN